MFLTLEFSERLIEPDGAVLSPLEAFPAASEAEWRARVAEVLKGKDFETLVTKTYDGLRVEPLHRAAEGEAPRALRQRPGAWRLAQRVDHPDLAASHALALLDLENGADALTLVAAASGAAHGFGATLKDIEDLEALLAGIEIDLISMRLDAGSDSESIAALFITLALRRRLTAAALDLDFGIDPIGNFARTGRLSDTPAALGGRAAALAARLRDSGFAGTSLLADGRLYHEAGASAAQELAFVLATGLAYMRLLEDAGMPIEAAAREIGFLLVADADGLVGLAKFRALRRLWMQIEAACGLSPHPIRLHAETAWRMLTKTDPWVNILRATLAAFSAGLGGADVVTVLSFTAALGLPDEEARRIARNTQLILLEEAGLGKVADPAAGAGGFEAITTMLCETAWALFQDIERAGGMIASLAAGGPQTRIAETARLRAAAIARRLEPLTGTSAFPHLAERRPEVLLAAPRREPAAAPAPAGALICVPLRSHRDGEPFEALRAAADAHLASNGPRPKIFLANLGSPAAFMTRAQFAKTFFEVGGLEAPDNDGFETSAAAAEAFMHAGTTLACLCASDALYAEMALPAVDALRAAGAARIYLAGRLPAMEAALQQAGLTAFVFTGCEALSLLEDALKAAGVALTV